MLWIWLAFSMLSPLGAVCFCSTCDETVRLAFLLVCVASITYHLFGATDGNCCLRRVDQTAQCLASVLVCFALYPSYFPSLASCVACAVSAVWGVWSPSVTNDGKRWRYIALSALCAFTPLLERGRHAAYARCVGAFAVGGVCFAVRGRLPAAHIVFHLLLGPIVLCVCQAVESGL